MTALWVVLYAGIALTVAVWFYRRELKPPFESSDSMMVAVFGVWFGALWPFYGTFYVLAQLVKRLGGLR